MQHEWMMSSNRSIRFQKTLRHFDASVFVSLGERLSWVTAQKKERERKKERKSGSSSEGLI